jgi:hypothetical protein
VLRLLVSVDIVPSSTILVTLIMQVIRTSETSVLTRATRSGISEDGILHDILTFILCAIRSLLTFL